jgi:tetratricopeptide (TPR) repeat protein
MSQPGRNDPCPCGSERRYKACCGRLRDSVAALALTDGELDRLRSLMSAGRFNELEWQARALLATKPGAGMLWQLLGAALRAQGKPALPAIERAAQLMPGDAAAHNNLGNALIDAGRLDEAQRSYRQALSLWPDFAEAHSNLGKLLFDSSQFAAAFASYQRVVELRPNHAEAWNQCAIAAHALGRLEQAVACHERAVALRPELAEAHHGLGLVLRDLDRLDQAIASYRRALALSPKSADLQRDLAVALRLQGRSDEAEASGRQAQSLDPASTATIVLLADIEADRGRFDAAEALLRRALSIEPASPDALAGIARLRRMTPDDGEWLSQAQALADSGLTPRREVPLRYAIGKFFDDLGHYPQAFAQFQRANELTRAYRSGHDRQRLTRAVDACIAAYPRAEPRSGRDDAVDSARPVLIVGMLRSGTSLAEQILASHPQAFGAGELIYWNRAARGGPAVEPGAAGDARLAGLATNYLQRLDELAPGALRVLDKMPANFQHLGLIHRALPNARFIHMRRNPIDTCLSIYFQHFEATHSYANELGDLAHAYGEYLRLMRHWRQLLPSDRLLEVRYEELVDDPKGCSRRMLEFIGLDWDPRCLSFERTERIVITASKWQVRQKINRQSVERWRHYQAQVGPLLALLESAQSS